MGLHINHNIFSILVQRNLDRSSQKLQTSYTNLSSGERINTAADDPSGMATSEGLRYEMQGLRQNQKNVSGAFNLIGTAESQLDTMVTVAQSMRDLIVQGGNSTLNASDRQTIQTQLNQLLDEMNRIASTAKFNDQYLLNGQMQGVKVQIGTQATDTLSVSLPDFRASVLGTWALKNTDKPVSATPLTAGAVTISGVAVPASTSDGISTAGGSASAIAKADAINRIETLTGVHATAQPTTLKGTNAVGPLTLDGTVNTLKINGVSIYPATVTVSSADSLIQAINARSGPTGVTAALGAGGALELTAADGRNIEVVSQGSIGAALGLAASGDVNTLATGQIQMTSTSPFLIGDAGGAIGMLTAQTQVNPDPATALQAINVSDPDAASRALQTMDAALAQLSNGRSTLGALNNRLESLSDTLAQKIDDLSKTDSTIRDADYAYESARYTQNQILQEAALSMLTQANISPKKALELLQG